MKHILFFSSLLLSFCLHASDFDGHWAINHEETDKVAVKYKDGSGVNTGSQFKPQVHIGMGLPLPRRFKQAPMSNLSPKDPAVLRCSSMEISTAGKKTKLVYDTAENETLVTGHYRGRDTKKKKKKIEQKYKTPDRKVTKSWTLRDDGRLLVSVKLNPTNDRARTFNRVFDRVDPSQLDVTQAPDDRVSQADPIQ
ncbi:MAG: hypothetical protein AAF541_11255 [Pseudomonadota bacterium]